MQKRHLMTARIRHRRQLTLSHCLASCASIELCKGPSVASNGVSNFLCEVAERSYEQKIIQGVDLRF